MQYNSISQDDLPGLPPGVQSKLKEMAQTLTSPGRAHFESFLDDRLYHEEGKLFLKELVRVNSCAVIIEEGLYDSGIDGADRAGRIANFNEAKKELGKAVQSALDSLKPVLEPLIADGLGSTIRLNAIAYSFVSYQQASLQRIQDALSR